MEPKKTTPTSYPEPNSDCLPADFLREELPHIFRQEEDGTEGKLRVLSLFSGCGGMDLGFEGHFIANRKSFAADDERIERVINDDWLLLRPTRFRTVFANDILPEACVAWNAYMRRFGYSPEIYHCQSVVELVKAQQAGADIFPGDIDVVTGGFPCQDFSVAGKRQGFDSLKDDKGQSRTADKPSEETRGKLYYWMKQVIDITRPKIFVAENVKGLVNLGNVKDIIQKDFASADGNGYIVLPPKVLHAGNYGVPETRERVIFIGVRRDALRPEAIQALESEVTPAEYDPYPIPTHAGNIKDESLLPAVTTRDVLKDLREPEETQDESQRHYSGAKYLHNGSQGQTEINLDGMGPTIRSEHHGNIEYRRLSAEHGGKQVAELAEGLKERRLTPRECALIQTFPPDYPFVIRKESERRFILSPSGAYKVIGNAVPPVLAFHLATRLESLWPIYFNAPKA